LEPRVIPGGLIAKPDVVRFPIVHRRIVSDGSVSVVWTRLPLASCESIVVPNRSVSVVGTRLPPTSCESIVVPNRSISVIGTRLPPTIVQAFVFGGAGVCPASNRLFGTIAHPRIQFVGLFFQLLRFGALPLGLSQTLLNVPLTLGRAQFGFGALPSCSSSSFIGCRLRGRCLGAKSLSFLAGISRLDFPALTSLSPHSR
jgi:hypothetical protein